MLVAFELVMAVAEAAALGAVSRAFVIGSYRVPTASMEPTICPGDRIVGEKVRLRKGVPPCGAVVTLRDPRNRKVTLVKRVIAHGGQQIDLVGGAVFVDGSRLDEPYVAERATLPGSGVDGGIRYPYRIPDGFVWVMGDNRTGSLDSRHFGPVDQLLLTSRIVAVVWPPDHVRTLG